MTDAAARLTAALSGRYRIEREVGQGGMATVYLAQDLKHDRGVALKVLHPELGAVIGAERFLQEIKTTARLQHPHILGLIDSGEAGGLLFYVMPFVNGESLRQKLLREKQLPVREAVRIATEVAGALDYAHRQGVVHRDIKPENVLLHDGQAMVADFGIALAVRVAGGGRLTQTGLSLGTPQYMSPEQALGERDITPRSDIYALGVMTYEMLTGDPPFTGSTNQAILARITTERPVPPRSVRETIPEHVEATILVGLAKLPADRWSTAKEFAEGLANPALTAGLPAAVSPPVGPTVARRFRRPWLIGALTAGALAAGVTAGWLLRPEPAVSPMAVEFFVDADSSHVMDLTSVAPLAVSPDGKRIAYRGRTQGRLMLFERRLEDRVARPVPGTENADHPFYSADSQWLAFDAAGELRKVPIAGGTPTLVVKVPTSTAGGSWSRDGTIVYSSGFPRALYRVSASGGTAERITSPDSLRGEAHVRPAFHPDGKTLVFSVTIGVNRALPVVAPARMGVLTLPDTTVTILDVPALAPHPVGSDQLAYGLADGGVVLRAFSLGARKFTGPERRVAEGVNVFAQFLPMLDVSSTGVIAFQPGLQNDQSMVLVGAEGAERRIFTGSGLWAPRFSPSGDRIAYAKSLTPGGGRDLWIYSIPQATEQRLTNRIFYAIDPAWTPDGKQLVFTGGDSRGNDLYVVPADGTREPRLLLSLPGFESQAVITPDGRRVVFAGTPPESNQRDLLSVPLTSPAAVEVVLKTEFDEGSPALSPDGRWLAYQSNEDGTPAVYVRPYPGPGPRQKISVGAAREPAWSTEGKAVFYRTGTELVRAALALGPVVTVRERRTLFDAPYITGRGNRSYDVDPLGRGLLFIKVATQSRLVVRMNVSSRGEP
jgi:eukaryotic-like serine/threonine-protein kinase